MTDKQECFCEEYLVDLNATQAAIRAGYSEKTAQEQGSQNLSKLIIQERIEELKRKRSERTEVTVDRVVKELAILAFADIADLLEVDKDGRVRAKSLDEIPADKRRALKGVKEQRSSRKEKGEKAEIIFEKTQYDTWDKVRALELLGRHLDMFTDLKLEVGEDLKAFIHRIFTDKRPIE